MAISSGAGAHSAWLEVGGLRFPILSGTAHQSSTRKSSTFNATIPLSYPGAYETLSTLGDNTASVNVITRGVQAALVTGEIDSVELELTGTNITVSGRDQSAKLHAKKSSEKWVNRKGHEIVTDLAGRVGLAVQVDQSVLMAGKQLAQDFVKLSDGISFSAVIHKIAELDGARWWVKNGTLFYRSLTDLSGVYTINWQRPTFGSPMRSDTLDLRIRRNIQAGKSIEVTVKSWHPKQKKVNEGKATVEGNGGPVKYEYHIPNLLQSHADKHAKSKANDHARHGVSISAKCVGDPSIDVAMGLRLNGTGVFDRTYEMDGIHHIYGMQGHTMTISAKLPTKSDGAGSSGSSGSGGGGGQSSSGGTGSGPVVTDDTSSAGTFA